jgi:ABC-type uncharacterized transport system permease subunit
MIPIMVPIEMPVYDRLNAEHASCSAMGGAKHASPCTPVGL